MGNLYVVATPIGNLEDITLRALRILSEAGLIAAEDTRVTRRILSRYKIQTKLISFNDHNERRRIPQIMKALSVGDVALVSDAGTPILNDPGFSLLVQAQRNSIPIIPIPGPSALTTAISVSSVPTNQFIFLGFLPKKKIQRRRELSALLNERKSLILFESPHRLLTTLRDIFEVYGDRSLCVARELTKFHEEIFNGKVSEAIVHFQQPLGEFSLVVAGYSEPELSPFKDSVFDALWELRRQGKGARESVKEISLSTKLSRREIYRMWLDLPPAPSSSWELDKKR